MKKFSEYNEDSINENKVYNRYMELSDKLFLELKGILKAEGHDITEGDKVDTFLAEMSEDIAKGVVDPKTIEVSGQQSLDL
ncbi:MAG: hypothetical protein SLAVMIC_00154 [uncultured marine phage]|uniref:Uncharacterized protein n=1 Tax=uncultured marine phage TaxID=707152 RepID=A0A8D9C9I0_9VIRU|nr:MAG: hypothetical protein SLAVMIC_00154 [uncultured marine phage]